MSSKEEILFKMQAEAFPVHIRHKTAIDTNNGVLNNDKLAREKRLALSNNMTYLTEELIKTKRSYPVNNISEVILEGDFVVVKRKDWKEVMKYIENE